MAAIDLTDPALLKMDQGAIMRASFTYLQPKESDSDPDVPYSNVGYHARMQVRYRAQAATLLFELTSTAGELILGGTNGVTDIIAPASKTVLVKRNARYDLRWINDTNPDDVIRVIGGPILLTPMVTFPET